MTCEVARFLRADRAEAYLRLHGTRRRSTTPVDTPAAGITDHITPWKGVFNTGRAFGGRNQFVLSSSGHIQSLINPPGNSKAKYFLNDADTAAADDWLANAKPTSDSWWLHWREWLVARSGELRDAPAALGNERYPPREAAPGTYVHER